MASLIWLFSSLCVCIYSLFINTFCLVESTENSKKKVRYKLDSLSYFTLWYEWVNIHVYFFSSMHVLNFIFWVCVICINNEIGMIIWFEIIILRSVEKGVLWKFWFDLRFPQNPKLKWILKWLPLDRGYFKVYFFYTRRKYTNNLVPYVSFDS